MEHVDGNVLAGPLGELFRFDLTTTSGECRHCHDVSVLARAIVLVGAGRDRPTVEPGAAEWGPSGGSAEASVTELGSRLLRLDRMPLPRPVEALVVAAAVALLAVPTVLLFAPAVAGLF